jgi:hypothetical protein
LRAAAIPIRPSYTARPGEAVHVFRDDDNWFAIGGGRVTIAPDSILFVNDVVGDIGRLAHSPEGREMLARGDALGHKVRIVKPDPPTEPPNGWIVPDDLSAATSGGAGCGSTIVYDPADWPRLGDRRSPTSVEILLLLLRQANLNASGTSNPSLPDWGDMA